MADRATSASTHVARSALLLAVLFSVDKMLALVRDIVISRAFGASAVLDAYYAAFELPDGLFTIIAGSAMATTLIPILTARIAQQDHAGAWRLVATVINWALIVVIGLSVVAIVFAPSIIRAVAPGFDERSTRLSADLMRIVLMQTVIFTSSGILMGALRAYDHFLLPALAPICYTLGRIGGTLFLAPRIGIFGLAWGGLVGSVVYFLVLVPGLAHFGARWSATLRHPDLHIFLGLMGPRVMGLGVTYLNFVLPTFLGSRLPAGAISAYEFGWRLMQFPETIIGTAVGVAVFPTLSTLANVGNLAGLRRTGSWALRLVLLLAIPAGVGLLLLGRPLTTLFLQRGAFDATATDRVVWALQFLSLGLIGHSALEVASRLFYAQRDMWLPFWAALAGLIVNVVVGWFALPHLAHGAIALANSLGACMQVVILLVVASRRLGGIETRSLAGSLARTFVASALMGAAIIGFRSLTPDAGLLVTAVGGLLVGAITFTVSAVLLGSEEIRALPSLLLPKR
jgi:putative peptidoglycan lipid II flippase